MLISGLMAITHLVRLCDGIHTKNAFSGYQNEKIVKKIPLNAIFLHNNVTGDAYGRQNFHKREISAKN